MKILDKLNKKYLHKINNTLSKKPILITKKSNKDNIKNSSKNIKVFLVLFIYKKIKKTFYY